MTSLQLTCRILGHLRFDDLACVVCGDRPVPRPLPVARLLVRGRR